MRHNEIVCLRTNIGNGNEWGYDFSDILCDKRGMGVLVNRCAAVTRPAFFAPLRGRRFWRERTGGSRWSPPATTQLKLCFATFGGSTADIGYRLSVIDYRLSVIGYAKKESPSWADVNGPKRVIDIV